MRIRILGSAASEGWPALFCGCEACQRARQLGGKDVRTRASMQVDDIYKIDLPPDSMHHAITYGLDFSRLEHLFISHSHGDHFALSEFEYLAEPFAHDRVPLTIHASGDVLDKLAKFGVEPERYRVTLRRARPFELIEAGDHVVMPILAIHKMGEECLNYVVEAGGRSVLYGVDTGWYPEETWRYLESRRLDCVIMEATMGLSEHFQFHMNFAKAVEAKVRLQKAGAIGPDSKFVVTHFSHNVGFSHAEIEDYMRPHGVEVAYDGIEILLE